MNMPISSPSSQPATPSNCFKAERSIKNESQGANNRTGNEWCNNSNIILGALIANICRRRSKKLMSRRCRKVLPMPCKTLSWRFTLVGLVLVHLLTFNSMSHDFNVKGIIGQVSGVAFVRQYNKFRKVPLSFLSSSSYPMEDILQRSKQMKSCLSLKMTSAPIPSGKNEPSLKSWFSTDFNCSTASLQTNYTSQSSQFTSTATTVSNASKQTTSIATTSESSSSSSSFTFKSRDQIKKLDLTLVLIDNYDSYTYNLYSYLSTICSKPPIVVSNDAYDTWRELSQSISNASNTGTTCIDGIVISPGPGRPEKHEDMGVCLQAIQQNPHIPILGVCLGHQALGYCYGADVTLAPCGPFHGLTSRVWFATDDDGEDDVDLYGSNGRNRKTKEKNHEQRNVLKCNLFKGIHQYFEVVRYHSLTVSFPSDEVLISDGNISSFSSFPTSPLEIEPIAWCSGTSLSEYKANDRMMNDDDVLSSHQQISNDNSKNSICMALRHKMYPHYGVQFHPESIGTGKEGYRILENFCEFCSDWQQQQQRLDQNIHDYNRIEKVQRDMNDDDYNDEFYNNDDDGVLFTKIGKENKGKEFKTEDCNAELYPSEKREVRTEKSALSSSMSKLTADRESINCNQRQSQIQKEKYLQKEKYPQKPKYQVFAHKISSASLKECGNTFPSPEYVYEQLYSSSQWGFGTSSFWLDSSTGRKDADIGINVNDYKNMSNKDGQERDGDTCSRLHMGNDNNDYGSKLDCPIISNSRFSIMGGDDGPLSKRIEYYGLEHTHEKRGLYVSSRSPNLARSSILSDCDKADATTKQLLTFGNDDLLTYLRSEINDNGIVDSIKLVDFEVINNESTEKEYDRSDKNFEYTSTSDKTRWQQQKKQSQRISEIDCMSRNPTYNPLPFDYRGGYVGYLGYEIRHDINRFMGGHEISDNSKISAVADTDDYTINESNPKQREDKLEQSFRKKTLNPNVPTASFVFADRSLVFDHWREDWYVIGVALNDDHDDGDTVEDTISWMRNVTSTLHNLCKNNVTAAANVSPMMKPRRKGSFLPNIEFSLSRSKEQYTEDIARCHKEIQNGESYELCLTNRLQAQVVFQSKKQKERNQSAVSRYQSSPFDLYKILRRKNPAPFAAFLNFNSIIFPNSNIGSGSKEEVGSSGSISICCSSPERFLSVTKMMTCSIQNNFTYGLDFAPQTGINSKSKYLVESKPIKGTCKRIIRNDDGVDMEFKLKEDTKLAEELQSSVKNRAENLMIVDLLRNDLSRVCDAGSVHVPKLMHIESFETLHQLVSTIRGTLNQEHVNIVDVIAACFPGGSMTGAPKLRTVDILDEIELGETRGPYSGSLGYLSLNGCMDMNIVIRTALVTQDSKDCFQGPASARGIENWRVDIGAGGAITALSDSKDEFDEMMLKAKAIMEAVQEWYEIGNIDTI